MEISSMGPTLLALFGLVVVFAFVLLRIEGLALFAPKSTKGITGAAAGFCSRGCRTPDGRCPLTGSAERAQDCPLWRFVDADVPTQLYGSPFEQVEW